MIRFIVILLLVLRVLPVIAQDETQLPSLEVEQIATIGIGGVSQASYSPNGDILALAGRSGIWLYEGETFNLIRHIEGLSIEVVDIVWSSDGERLATANGDETFTIWDAKTGNNIQTFSTITSDVETEQLRSIAWSPDQTLIVTGNSTGFTQFWEADTGESRGHVRNGARPIESVSWSHNGQYLATVGAFGIGIYDIETWLLVKEINGHGLLAWSPTDLVLAFNDYNNLYLWDIVADEYILLDEENDMNTFLGSIEWSSDGNRLLTAGELGIVIWDVENQQKVIKYGKYSGLFYDTVWMPDRNYITRVTMSMIEQFDVETGETIFSTDVHRNGFNDIAWSPDNSELLTISGWSPVHRWSADGELLDLIPNPNKEIYKQNVRELAWSADGTAFSTFTHQRSDIWDVETGESIWNFEESSRNLAMISWSPAEPITLIADRDEGLGIWDLESRDYVDQNRRADAVRSIEWTTDGQYYIVNRGLIRAIDNRFDSYGYMNIDSQAGTVDIKWSPDNLNLATILVGGQVYVTDLAGGEYTTTELGRFDYDVPLYWLSDSKHFVFHIEQTIYVWHYQNGFVDFYETKNGLKSISPNGKWLMVGGANGIIDIFDPISGQLITSVENSPGHRIERIDWSDDSSHFATLSYDNILRTFQIIG